MLVQDYWNASCTGPSAKTVLNFNKAPAVSVLLAQLDPPNAAQYEIQAAFSFTPFLEQSTPYTPWVSPDLKALAAAQAAGGNALACKSSKV